MKCNLDQWAALAAQKMTQNDIDAKKLYNVINKVLGVLQSQGVYACMLYLYAESDQESASQIRASLWKLLERLDQEAKINWLNSSQKQLPKADPKTKGSQQQILKFYSDTVAADLDTLLLVRDLYEQMLIYARYHAKALGG